MGGIAGLILDEVDPRGTGWLTAMTQRLYHRGPDDGGAVAFGMGGRPAVRRRLAAPAETVDWCHVPMRLGLGARRLAVVDRSAAGRQPMATPDGRIWLVYNGELNNYVELRSELRDRGMIFEGHSDTEVLLAAYRAWGCECFKRLDGMWAVALCDWAAGRLVLSRDYLGIKPLYIGRFDGGLAFASEIKSLLVLPRAVWDVNQAGLRDFLCDGRIDHTEHSLFEGIWSFPAGCWVELDLRARGALHAGGAVRRFWRPCFGWSDVSDAPRRVARSLADSVAAHVQGDLPIGASLSGGLDSSAIVSLVHRLRESDPQARPCLTQHVFSASLPGSHLDEASHAKAVVDMLPGMLWHKTEPTPQRMLEALTSLMWHQEEPFGSPSVYLQWEVMRLARETGVGVLLDGHGADGLFCGLEGLIPAYLAHLVRRGEVLTFRREYRAASRDHYTFGGLAVHVAAALLPEWTRRRLRLRRDARRQPWLVRELFSAEEMPGMCEVLGLTPADRADGTWSDPTLSRYLWSRLLWDSLPSVLRFEDRNSMAFSIEGRMPFLAREVVELAMRLPMAEKIKDGSLKAVLRKAMRGVVPDIVLDRRDKIGFSAPTADWMRGGLGEWWRDLLGSQSFRERGCYEMKAVDKLVARFNGGDTSVALVIWRMAIVEQWARQFLDRAEANHGHAIA